MKDVLPQVLRQLRAAGGATTDAELLARFVADRDEDAFAALVRRYGPMVLGVCRRVLRDAHDAEDAFQATFLVLARKAVAVARRASVGAYLHAVAYHAALASARANARRRARERQVTDMPHPQVEPAEAQDWREILDRELGRLPEIYRAAVALCDLGAVPQRQAALLLGVSTGTLSNRLNRARALLARRLRDGGVELTGAALAAALASEAASARVPAALVGSTARVAALVAAGQLAGAAVAPAILMKGVMRAMLMRKLKFVALAVAATVALGVVGLSSRTGEEVRAQDASTPAARSGGKPASELEALRRENEDLRATIRVLLKEIQTLQRGTDAVTRNALTGPRDGNRAPYRDNSALPGKMGSADTGRPKGPGNLNTTEHAVPGAKAPSTYDRGQGAKYPETGNHPGASPKTGDTSAGGQGRAHEPNLIGLAREVEDALQALHRAGDPESRRRAAEALDRATRRIRERYAPTTAKPKF